MVFLLDFLSTASVARFCYKQCNSVQTLKISIFSSQVFLLCVCSFYLLRPFRKALNVRRDIVSARRGYAVVSAVTVFWHTAQICRLSIRWTRESFHNLFWFVHTHLRTLCMDGIPVSLQGMTSQLIVLKIALFYTCDAFRNVCKSWE